MLRVLMVMQRLPGAAKEKPRRSGVWRGSEARASLDEPALGSAAAARQAQTSHGQPGKRQRTRLGHGRHDHVAQFKRAVDDAVGAAELRVGSQQHVTKAETLVVAANAEPVGCFCHVETRRVVQRLALDALARQAASLRRRLAAPSMVRARPARARVPGTGTWFLTESDQRAV